MKPLVFPSQFQGAHFYFGIELFSNLEYQNPNKYSLVADPTYLAEFVLEGFQKMDLSELASVVLEILEEMVAVTLGIVQEPDELADLVHFGLAILDTTMLAVLDTVALELLDTIVLGLLDIM